MIYPDFQLRALCEHGQLVTPYDPECVNPASYDLKLGPDFIDLHTGLAFKEENFVILKPGAAILATTLEYVRIPDGCAASLFLKSSMARKGLDHALAGWVDPGFH